MKTSTPQELQTEQGDIDAFTRSLRMQGTPWALGCEALILHLWREARLARSERGDSKSERITAAYCAANDYINALLSPSVSAESRRKIADTYWQRVKEV